MQAATLPDDLTATAQRALDEDVGSGDLTAMLIPEHTRTSGRILCREKAVLCGTAWADAVAALMDRRIVIEWLARDGDLLQPDQHLARLEGPARSLLTAERCMLNFLQTLSGTATVARDYAERVAHTGVQLLDTRKTLPGLRTAQKYAVRTGGCSNHRMGLYDAFLIKENHISACGSITAAVEQARHVAADRPVEVEVETLEQLKEALSAGADIVMLDNFTPPRLREAVALNRGRSRLEASGGITDANLVEVAETGVDHISIGALTKHCRAIDLSFRLDDAPAGC
ncbi:MAG: carboxylating nicotinate-nucleotide diphosphorylase [Pseudomonadota bacterium]